MLSYLWGSKATSTAVKILPDTLDISVSVAESVTAGAVCNELCSEPGASSYFKGGITAYSVASKKEILGIDTNYAEQNNYANPFTTAEMAKAVVKMFKSRFGISTTGYSLPYHREENKELGECELHIDTPYAYICIYDSWTDESITVKEEFEFNPALGKALQRASMQAKTALSANRMYKELAAKATHAFESRKNPSTDSECHLKTDLKLI